MNNIIIYNVPVWHLLDTGQIKVNRRLDYESLNSKLIKFRVRAFSQDNLRSVDANITIQVQDINDNIPIFLQTVSSVWKS